MKKVWIGMTQRQVETLLGPEDSGLGSGDVVTQEWVSFYPLLAFPSDQQREVAGKRWGPEEPVLLVHFRTRDGVSRVVQARVGSDTDGMPMLGAGDPPKPADTSFGRQPM